MSFGLCAMLTDQPPVSSRCVVSRVTASAKNLGRRFGQRHGASVLLGASSGLGLLLCRIQLRKLPFKRTQGCLLRAPLLHPWWHAIEHMDRFPRWWPDNLGLLRSRSLLRRRLRFLAAGFITHRSSSPKTSFLLGNLSLLTTGSRTGGRSMPFGFVVGNDEGLLTVFSGLLGIITVLASFGDLDAASWAGFVGERLRKTPARMREPTLAMRNLCPSAIHSAFFLFWIALFEADCA